MFTDENNLQDNTQPSDSGQQDPLTVLLQGQIEVLEAEVKRISGEMEEWKDKALRAQAEFQNARSRYEKEKADLLLYGNERLLKELLPSLDTFNQAFAHLPDDLKQHQWVQGIIQCEKMLVKHLENTGLKKIEITAGITVFDPLQHEAISQEETEDSKKNTILECYQEGYSLGEKIIRPARVKVGI